MRYTWDEAKNAANRRKHAIAFADAALIFDGDILEWPHERFDYGEERWIAIGVTQGAEILVVYTEEGDGRRILSARPATKRERRLYWQTVSRAN